MLEKGKNKSEKGPSEWLRPNFIFIAMFVAIASGIIYWQFYQEETKAGGAGDGPNSFKLPLILLTLIVFIIFVVWMIFDSKKFEQEAKKEIPVNQQKSFVNRMSKEEYAKYTEEITKKELDKLYQTPNFRKMIEEKGSEPNKNWIWQTKEKEKKTVWRERENYSDEENSDDHLSQVDISEDEK